MVKTTPGVPESFKTYSPFPFAGIDLEGSPLAIDDKSFYYLENFIRTGDGYLRTAWDVGAPIYTAPTGLTIVSFNFFTIGSNYYAIVFLNDGSAVQVAAPPTGSGATTPVGPSGTFYLASSGYLPAVSQWGTQFIIISNRNTPNDYWIWDGALLYGAGTLAPTSLTNPTLTSAGTGYNSPPTIFLITPNGSGSGGAVAASVQGGSVVNLQVTNPGSGYAPGDLVQALFSAGGSDIEAHFKAQLVPALVTAIDVLVGGSGYTSAPTVTITSTSGSGAAATATITNGVVTGVNVTAQGGGYIFAPTITFSGGGGSGATAVALLSAGGIAAIALARHGSGYREPPLLSIVGGGGAGATGGTVLTPTGVDVVNVAAGGTGYTSPPTVTITSGDGNGSGATADANLANGSVSNIVVTDNGSGYTTTPIVTLSGGGGTGAAAAAQLQLTTVASAYVSNAGFGYTSAPSVEVLPGANNSAAAILDVMPYGVSGSCLETFNSRVWIGNPSPPMFGTLPPGGNFSFSAAESFTDFSTVDGGGEFTSSDRFLLTQYVGLRQSNGYLYAFGDGSVSVISNVQTAGSPATTSFTYQNVEPQSGLTWRDSMQDFGRAVTFGNETGRYGLYGGNVAKISGKLDRLFLNALFPPAGGAIAPSGASATIFNVKHDLMLMTIVDPDTGAARNVMTTWNEKSWTITSQSPNLTYIGPQKVKSVFTAWGTDGSSLYPLFQQPSSGLVKRLDTKIYGADSLHLVKDLYSLHVSAQDLSSGQVGVVGSVAFNVSGPAQQAVGFPSVPSSVYSNVLIGSLSLSAPPPAWPVWTSGTNGLPFNLIGMRMRSTSPDFVLGDLILGWVPVSFTN